MTITTQALLNFLNKINNIAKHMLVICFQCSPQPYLSEEVLYWFEFDIASYI